MKQITKTISSSSQLWLSVCCAGKFSKGKTWIIQWKLTSDCALCWANQPGEREIEAEAGWAWEAGASCPCQCQDHQGQCQLSSSHCTTSSPPPATQSSHNQFCLLDIRPDKTLPGMSGYWPELIQHRDQREREREYYSKEKYFYLLFIHSLDPAD